MEGFDSSEIDHRMRYSLRRLGDFRIQKAPSNGIHPRDGWIPDEWHRNERRRIEMTWKQSCICSIVSNVLRLTILAQWTTEWSINDIWQKLSVSSHFLFKGRQIWTHYGKNCIHILCSLWEWGQPCLGLDTESQGLNGIGKLVSGDDFIFSMSV
jgi:hypothetical protein